MVRLGCEALFGPDCFLLQVPPIVNGKTDGRGQARIADTFSKLELPPLRPSIGETNRHRDPALTPGLAPRVCTGPSTSWPASGHEKVVDAVA